MQQVAVCVVNLDCIESSLKGPLGGCGIGDLEVLDILQRHLLGVGVVFVPWDRAWGIGVIRPSVQLLHVSHGSRRVIDNS